jgi:hypothetical protein
MQAARVLLLVLSSATCAAAGAADISPTKVQVLSGVQGALAERHGASADETANTGSKPIDIRVARAQVVGAVARELNIYPHSRRADGWLMFLILVGLIAHQLRRKQQSVSQLLAG